jgi:formylglycine-generating enzyme required for sulfatase activity
MTMTTFLLLLCLCGAEADETNSDTGRILKRFRDEFVLLTPGEGAFPASFLMGTAEGGDEAERPVRRVTWNYHFSIGRYEVPQNLYQAVMGDNPSRWKGERNSVEMVNFDDAAEFCRKATAQMRAAGLIEQDEVIRLPTEAEWEYAARAGSASAYSFGDDPGLLGEYAWYTDNAAGNDPPVGAKKPNAWGLYDLHGYLWEWCADVGHPNYEGAPTDGSARLDGDQPEHRVIRGGSWKDPADRLRSATRAGRLRLLVPAGVPGGVLVFQGGVPRQLRDDALGFRCVLSKSTAHDPGRGGSE